MNQYMETKYKLYRQFLVLGVFLFSGLFSFILMLLVAIYFPSSLNSGSIVNNINDISWLGTLLFVVFLISLAIFEFLFYLQIKKVVTTKKEINKIKKENNLSVSVQ
ncbi:hypothetical protein [[Mycoplasma] testudinis]|uniref:hypothetical protein n=1 Tax=[Mycoplasma] testudinis TaxID=33924 RepID=UPI0004876F6C|nr:hypothetical protein [[Mycoplasma] testudinis]